MLSDITVTVKALWINHQISGRCVFTMVMKMEATYQKEVDKVDQIQREKGKTHEDKHTAGLVYWDLCRNCRRNRTPK